MAVTLRFDLTKLAVLCAALIWLTIAADLVYLWDVFNVRAFFDLVESGTLSGADLMAAGEAVDARSALIAKAYLVIFIATALASSFWIYRASWNAREIRPDEGRITPGWAVGWFFVPVMSLWKPFQAMRQCWNSSHDAASALDAPVPGFVGLWWALWVVTNLLSSLSFQLWMKADTMEDFRMTTVLDMITGPLNILCALLFVRLIKSITRAQRDVSPGLAAVSS